MRSIKVAGIVRTALLEKMNDQMNQLKVPDQTIRNTGTSYPR